MTCKSKPFSTTATCRCIRRCMQCLTCNTIIDHDETWLLQASHHTPNVAVLLSAAVSILVSRLLGIHTYTKFGTGTPLVYPRPPITHANWRQLFLSFAKVGSAGHMLGLGVPWGDCTFDFGLSVNAHTHACTKAHTHTPSLAMQGICLVLGSPGVVVPH